MGPDAPSPGGPSAWSDPDPGRPLPFRAALRDDIEARVPMDRRSESRGRRAATALGIVVRSSAFHATLLYRAAHALRHRLGLPDRALAGLLFWWGRHRYSCAIASTARLHGGLILPHLQGIVIGPGVTVVPCAWIFRNVTPGGAPGRDGMPQVGADARIYAGAVLTGPIRLGDAVMVGANAVVHRDVPGLTLIRCVSAEFSPLPERFHP